MTPEARLWLYAAAAATFGALLIATPTALRHHTRKEETQ